MQVFSPGLVLALKVGALGTVAAGVASLFLWRRYMALEPAMGDPVPQVWTFFMRLRWSGLLVRLIAAIGLLWILLLLGLSLTDYLTRHAIAPWSLATESGTLPAKSPPHARFRGAHR